MGFAQVKVLTVNHSGNPKGLFQGMELPANENSTTTKAITAAQFILAKTAEIVLPIDLQKVRAHYKPIKPRTT